MLAWSPDCRANVFFIIFVIAAICTSPTQIVAASHARLTSTADSIVSVTYFAEVAPERFGTFGRVFITMFTLTMNSIDWWFVIFPAVLPDTVNSWPCFYVVSYVLLCRGCTHATCDSL